MPHLPAKKGSFPIILRDYMVPDPIRGELLFNYESNELYFAKGTTGEVVSVARDIYDKILSSRIQNNKIYIIDRDKIKPPPQKDELVPPYEERIFNSIYYIITSRKDYGSDINNPLTAPTWAVRKNKTFLGKASNYNVDADV